MKSGKVLQTSRILLEYFYQCDGTETDHFLDPPTQFFCQRNKWMVPNTLIWTFPIRYALIASFFTPSKLANTKVSSIVVTFNTKTMDTRRSMKGRKRNIFIELLLTTCFHEKQKPKTQIPNFFLNQINDNK